MHTSILDPDPDSLKRNTAARRRPTQPWSASLFGFGHSLHSSDFIFLHAAYHFRPSSPPSPSTELHSPRPAIAELIVDVNAHTRRPYSIHKSYPSPCAQRRLAQLPPAPKRAEADVGYSGATTTRETIGDPLHFGQGQTDTVTRLSIVVTRPLFCGYAPRPQASGSFVGTFNKPSSPLPTHPFE